MKRYDDPTPRQRTLPRGGSESSGKDSGKRKIRPRQAAAQLASHYTRELRRYRATRSNSREYVIGTEVLKKPDSYDPRSDSLVRVLASRLRVKLKEYYSDGGSEDPLVIEFPKGKYIPRFQRREQVQSEVEKRLRARNAFSLGTIPGR